VPEHGFLVDHRGATAEPRGPASQLPHRLSRPRTPSVLQQWRRRCGSVRPTRLVGRGYGLR
jgi:hypothetical protein